MADSMMAMSGLCKSLLKARDKMAAGAIDKTFPLLAVSGVLSIGGG
jgi:hypothetical protein